MPLVYTFSINVTPEKPTHVATVKCAAQTANQLFKGKVVAHRPTEARQSLAFFMFHLEVGMANWMNNLFGLVGGLCVRAWLCVQMG